MKKPARPRLKVPPGAELIIKSNVECSTRFPGLLAPGVFVLGNKEGIRWLSAYLARIADEVSEEAPFNDGGPDDHRHLDDGPPVNPRLSDDFGIMIGSFSAKHRRRILHACGGVSKAKRVTGSPIRHLLHHLQFIESLCGWDDELTSGVLRDLRLLSKKVQAVLDRFQKGNVQHNHPRRRTSRRT